MAGIVCIPHFTRRLRHVEHPFDLPPTFTILDAGHSYTILRAGLETYHSGARYPARVSWNKDQLT